MEVSSSENETESESIMLNRFWPKRSVGKRSYSVALPVIMECNPDDDTAPKSGTSSFRRSTIV